MSGRGSEDGALEGDGMGRVGNFRFFYEGERWEWSKEVAALHGYAPGEVVPTTELMRRHKHPDDRAGFDAMLAEMLTQHAPFSSRHRIIDTHSNVHTVAVIAHTIIDDNGDPIGTEGFYLDLADSEGALVQSLVDEQVQDFRENSGIIEQAKGMIMFAYGVNADRAFDVLRWRSQDENVKVKDVAAAIVAAARVDLAVSDQTRRRFDHIVLTAQANSSPDAGPAR